LNGAASDGAIAIGIVCGSEGVALAMAEGTSLAAKATAPAADR
jgi:hypothetical protein